MWLSVFFAPRNDRKTLHHAPIRINRLHDDRELVKMYTAGSGLLVNALPDWLDGGADPPRIKRWIAEHGRDLAFDSNDVVLAAREAGAAPWRIPGVYFLVWNGKVCYVGQSRDIGARVSRHLDEGKPFQRVAWILAPEFAAPWIEHEYVDAWRPPWNCACTRPCLDLGFDDIANAIAGTSACDVALNYTAILDPCHEPMSAWRLHVLGYEQALRRKGEAP